LFLSIEVATKIKLKSLKQKGKKEIGKIKSAKFYTEHVRKNQ